MKIPTLKELEGKVPFERVQIVTKVIQLISAGVLIVESVIRFAYVMTVTSFASFMLTFYLLFFAAIFVCTEMSVGKFRTWFFFLNFAWGKGLACFFIAFLVLGSGFIVDWCDILTGLYFFALGIILPFLSLIHKGTELEFVELKLKQIEIDKEEKQKEGDNRI